ncbi:hypothetical protein, partial [Verrucomicrobium spinosum]|uniref:hypothetical protein n=1 Tax=Verrucomicrobium spinosum TaxID=2736 RepID=UPI0012E1CD37
MNHHVRILHDNEEYFVCLHNSEGPTGEDMIQFQAWAPTLQEAMQRLSQKLEACDQPWKPEIHVGSYAAIILSRDDAARFYLKSLSVPVFYEPADSAPPAELVDLGNLSSEDYITTLCHLSDAHIHRLLAKAPSVAVAVPGPPSTAAAAPWPCKPHARSQSPALPDRIASTAST